MSDPVPPAAPPDPFSKLTGNPLDTWLIWTIGVWAGLGELLEHGEWSQIRSAGDELPAGQQGGWENVVRDGEAMWRGLRADPRVLPGAVFLRAVQHLNEHWFIPRGLIVYCFDSETAAPVALEVCRIDREQRFDTPDGEVRSFTVTPLFPRPPYGRIDGRRKNYADPHTGWVRIDAEHWDKTTLAHFSLRDENYRRDLVRRGARPADVEFDARIAAALTHMYPSPHAWAQAQITRTQVELVRRAMLCRRVLAVEPNAMLTSDFRWLVPDVLLPPGCRLRQELFHPPVDRAVADAEEEQLRRSQTVTDLAGQLTAAIQVPPQVVILEWLRRLRARLTDWATDRPPASDDLAHPSEATPRLAVALLAEQLRLSTRWALRGCGRGEYEQLAVLAEALYLRPSPELRLALKAVFEREFDAGPIDGPPFAPIGSDGNIVPLSPPPEPPPGS